MSEDKIIKFPDYTGAGNFKNTSDNKKNRKNKSVLRSLMKWIIALIITACITAYITTTLPHYLSPMYTDISIQNIGLDFCQIQIDSKDKVCEMYSSGSIPPRTEIYLDNNNDSFIRITDICVNVIDYAYITEEDIIYSPDIGGSGDIEPPIYLKTKIEPHVGTMKAEIDWDLNLEYGKDTINESDSYIEIAQKTSDKFFLTMNTNKQGYYSIEVEFRYKYHGKMHTIKTETIDYIFIEKPENDTQLESLYKFTPVHKS